MENQNRHCREHRAHPFAKGTKGWGTHFGGSAREFKGWATRRNIFFTCSL
jgi:hypothetical protein